MKKSRKPSPLKLEALRQQKLKEKEMGALLKELGFYMLFLFLLFMVSSGNREPEAYSLRRVLDDKLMHGKSGGKKIEDVSTQIFPLVL